MKIKFYKNIFYRLPKPIKILFVRLVEFYGFIYIKYRIKRPVKIKKNLNKNGKKNILIYHISALSFGGTEKNLQMIAKYLDKDKYNVYLLHGTKTDKDRSDYLKDSGVNIIKFDYSRVGKNWPFIIYDMSPGIEEIINKYNIDLIITASPGHTMFPIINIKKIPIILLNIFGSFNTQKNIIRNISISEEVAKLANRVNNNNRSIIQYIPSERPLDEKEKAKNIRNRFNIKETDLVFGRIGRPDDAIFDPIAIKAFEIAVKEKPDLHYIIMSPANLAKKLVKDNKIPNVYFLEPSYEEKDIWAFHQAIDILAHFRNDGESCGLNIIESMLVGNPILTHKSHIWNAHLEYLDDSFSLVSEKDDYKKYAENMLTMYENHKNGDLKSMGQKAKAKAEKLFLIENVIDKYEKIIDESLKE